MSVVIPRESVLLARGLGPCRQLVFVPDRLVVTTEPAAPFACLTRQRPQIA